MSSKSRDALTSAKLCSAQRCHDRLYVLLTTDTTDEVRNMLQAVHTLVKGHSTHPDVDYVFKEAQSDTCTARALLLYALVIESDFCTYMMQRADIDADALSQFVHSILGPNVEQLMNGMMSMEYFVNTCLLEYVTM